jgi:bifunctional non-homologous end joining protein LigD
MNQSIALAFNDLAQGGSSDKVYHLALVGDEHSQWNVEIQYGRRGAALMSQTKASSVPYLAAKKVFDKVLREKLAKGYLEQGAPVAPQVAPSGASTEGIKPPELLEEISNGDYKKFVDDPHYFMQDKSDGVSRGVVKRNGEIFGINKRGIPVPLPEELVLELGRIKATGFQIDAELVGAKLICRDLLVAGGEDLSALTYGQRLSRLRAVLARDLTSAQLIAVVETWAGADKGPQLERSRAARREGVVFKLIAAPYRAGRNGQHKKYKFIKTLSAIAGRPRAGGKESVELFLWDNPDRTDTRMGITPRVPTLVRCGTVSLIGKPAIKEGDIVEVAYLYAQPSGLMSQARILSVRDDVTAEECTTEQLIFKTEEA